MKDAQGAMEIHLTTMIPYGVVLGLNLFDIFIKTIYMFEK